MNTRTDMSNEAILAQTKLRCAQLGLDNTVAEQLVQKYGKYAPILVAEAHFPGDVHTLTGYPYAGSKRMVQNFLTNELTPEQVAKICNEGRHHGARRGRQTVTTDEVSAEMGGTSSGREELRQELSDQAQQVQQPQQPVRRQAPVRPTPLRPAPTPTPVQTPVEQEPVQTGQNGGRTLFIGDSRTVGMGASVPNSTGRDKIVYTRERGGAKIDGVDRDGNRWYAKEGQGLDWLNQHWDDIKQRAQDCDVVVINLGVNDIGRNPDASARRYIARMNEMAAELRAQGKQVVFTSVNPVNERAANFAGYPTNADIDRFNEQVRAGLSSDTTFVNTNADLRANQPRVNYTGDGLHYNNYGTIGNYLTNKVHGIIGSIGMGASARGTTQQEQGGATQLRAGWFNRDYMQQTTTSRGNLFTPQTTLSGEDGTSGDNATLSADEVTVRPVIRQERVGRNGVHNIMQSEALWNGFPIVEQPDSTRESLYGVSHEREVGTARNPVGIKGFDGQSHYYGAMQHNPDGVRRMSLYAAVHSDLYGDYVNKVFNTQSTGFQQALEEFKADVERRGKLAYGAGSRARMKLERYIKPDYLRTFENEGRNNPEIMLQFQRDAASAVTASFYDFNSIERELAKTGLNLSDVNPAVLGMVISVGIARGNIDGIGALFRGKTKGQINSPEMVDAIARKYSGVFRRSHPNEMAAVKWAKDHINEKHSATTLHELSLITGDPSYYQNYLTMVAEYQNPDQQQQLGDYRYANAGRVTPPLINPRSRQGGATM